AAAFATSRRRQMSSTAKVDPFEGFYDENGAPMFEPVFLSVPDPLAEPEPEDVMPLVQPEPAPDPEPAPVPRASWKWDPDKGLRSAKQWSVGLMGCRHVTPMDKMLGWLLREHVVIGNGK